MVEWGFIAINVVGSLFFLVVTLSVFRHYLKTRHAKKFWLFVLIAFLALTFRGINGVYYELFGYTIFGEERTNITLIVAAIFLMLCYFPLSKKIHKKIKKSAGRKKKKERKKRKKKTAAAASSATSAPSL